MSARDWFTKLKGSSGSQFADGSGSLSGVEFEAKTARLAAQLAARFPQARSRLGLWGENSLDYLVALLAVLRAGHVAVPLSTRLTPRDLVDISGVAELDGLLAARELPASCRAALEALPILGLAPAPEGAPGRIKELGSSDIAVMICSSGSRGRVKIVPHTLKALLDHAAAVGQHLGVTWKDNWVACLPFYHIGGIAIPFRCLVSGASLVMPRGADPEEINRLIDVEGASLVSVVATVLERMLYQRGVREYPKSLRAIIVGGGPVPAPLLARCEQAYATYGLTEAGSMVTCARPGSSDTERRSAGPALPGTDVRIIDERGKEVKGEGEGQIIVRGPGMARGYLGNPEADARVFKGGWVYTGDVGKRDAKGFLHVLARREDLVLSGGENIYPAEIEAALREHPRVVAAVVLPVEDPEWGQVPAAFIVLSPGRPLERVHIFLHLEGRLARHKFPRVLVFADALPTLPTGKPDVLAIRKQLSQKR